MGGNGGGHLSSGIYGGGGGVTQTNSTYTYLGGSGVVILTFTF